MANDRSNNKPKASDVASEALEALGKNLAKAGTEKSARVLVAWCWRKGIKSSGFVNAIALALKILIHSLPSDRNQAALEGAVEGIEQRVETELEFLRRQPDDAARNAVIAEALGEPAPTNHAHGGDSHHGSHGGNAHAHTTSSSGAAKDAKTLMGYISRLPGNKRQQAIDFFRAFSAGAPKTFQLIEQFQARDGFLERLFHRVETFWDDEEFLAMAIKDLLGEEIKGIQHEKDNKPVARVQRALGTAFQQLEDGLTFVGVPKIGHGHDEHDHNPTPVTPGHGENWGDLMNQVRNRH